MYQNHHTDFKVAITNTLNKVKVNTLEINGKIEVFSRKIKTTKKELSRNSKTEKYNNRNKIELMKS